MAKLARTEAEQRLKSLNGWTLEGDAIKKQYTFKDFPEAIAFVNRLAPKAEAADHHPDILINYKRVTLTYSTHSEGGLTAKDFEGAGVPVSFGPDQHSGIALDDLGMYGFTKDQESAGGHYFPDVDTGGGFFTIVSESLQLPRQYKFLEPGKV